LGNTGCDLAGKDDRSMARLVTIATFNMGFYNRGQGLGEYQHPSSIKFGPTLEDNLGIFEGKIREAGEELGADFVCFSEHGLIFGVEAGDGEPAVDVPGPEMERLGRAAKAGDCYVIMGLLERHAPKPYNSAVLLGPEGGVVGVYRKVHLTPGERIGTEPGSEWPVFETRHGKVGIQICYDYYFPEATRCLALGGAEIVFSPTMQDARGIEQVMALQRARAVDNGIFYVSSVTNTGMHQPHCTTRSVVVDPVGVIRADSGFRDGWAVATVDLDDPFPQHWCGVAEPQRMRAMMMKGRRPEMYGAITEPRESPPWREIVLDGSEPKYPE
jgi:predicted amidohydrolase